jgi:hypothetical protein
MSVSSYCWAKAILASARRLQHLAKLSGQQIALAAAERAAIYTRP